MGKSPQNTIVFLLSNNEENGMTLKNKLAYFVKPTAFGIPFPDFIIFQHYIFKSISSTDWY